MKIILALISLSWDPATSFMLQVPPNRNSVALFSAPPATDMRLGDIKSELKGLGVGYSDCFDKESLVKRLQDVRDGIVQPEVQVPPCDKTVENDASQPVSNIFDEEGALSDLRSKTLKELKIECSQRSLRYATFLEKQDFVQAILKDMKAVAAFSTSGALRPGKASELTGLQLDEEILSHDTPILLDVYATWCGPCKLMAPELEKVAEELGSKCRVGKLDSDQNPEWSTRYKVQGLPTTLVIHKGEVQARLEGAHMKDGLLELVQPFV